MKMQSGNDDDATHVNRVKERFERDFLSRFGPLWRRMIETEQVKIRNGVVPMVVPKPIPTPAPSTQVPNRVLDFDSYTNVIEEKKFMSVRVPAKNDRDHGDAGSQSPVAEWEPRRYSDDDDDDDEDDNDVSASSSSQHYDSPSISINDKSPDYRRSENLEGQDDEFFTGKTFGNLDLDEAAITNHTSEKNAPQGNVNQDINREEWGRMSSIDQKEEDINPYEKNHNFLRDEGLVMERRFNDEESREVYDETSPPPGRSLVRFDTPDVAYSPTKPDGTVVSDQDTRNFGSQQQNQHAGRDPHADNDGGDGEGTDSESSGASVVHFDISYIAENNDDGDGDCDDDGDGEDDHGGGTDSDSSGASVVQFDISYIVEDNAKFDEENVPNRDDDVLPSDDRDNMYMENYEPDTNSLFEPMQEVIKSSMDDEDFGSHDKSHSFYDAVQDETFQEDVTCNGICNSLDDDDSIPSTSSIQASGFCTYSIDISHVLDNDFKKIVDTLPNRIDLDNNTPSNSQGRLSRPGDDERPSYEYDKRFESYSPKKSVVEIDGDEDSEASWKSPPESIDDEGSYDDANDESIQTNGAGSTSRYPPRGASKGGKTSPDSKNSDSSPEREWADDSSSEGDFHSPDEYESGSDSNDSEGKFPRIVHRRRRSSIISKNTREGDDENQNPNKKRVTVKTHQKKAPAMSKAGFKRNRERLAKEYFAEFNRIAFNGRLSEVDIFWSNKLRTTAGRTHLKRRNECFAPGAEPIRLASIELSTKVLDGPERLRSTLLHEMVHGAQWLVDGVHKPAHGSCFKKWAKIAMRKIPDVTVTTTHDYEIEYKYAWACTAPGCDFIVKRHSRSVDLKKHCCGRCGGQLIEVDAKTGRSKIQSATINGNSSNKKAPTKATSSYNLFIKENSKPVREYLIEKQKKNGIHAPKVTQSQVLKECAKLWRLKKQEK